MMIILAPQKTNADGTIIPKTKKEAIYLYIT